MLCCLSYLQHKCRCAFFFALAVPFFCTLCKSGWTKNVLPYKPHGLTLWEKWTGVVITLLWQIKRLLYDEEVGSKSHVFILNRLEQDQSQQVTFRCIWLSLRELPLTFSFHHRAVFLWQSPKKWENKSRMSSPLQEVTIVFNLEQQLKKLLLTKCIN